MRAINTPGEDHDDAWNDRHFQHVWFWLIHNPSSPYCGAPTMLLTAMGIDKRYWFDFKKAFNTGNFNRYRFSVRLSLTSHLKRVLSGKYDARVTQRNRLGRVKMFVVKPALDPKPLPCPAFYRGSIKITTRGLQLALRRTDATLAPNYDPEGMKRLTQAFQSR